MGYFPVRSMNYNNMFDIFPGAASTETPGLPLFKVKIVTTFPETASPETLDLW